MYGGCIDDVRVYTDNHMKGEVLKTRNSEFQKYNEIDKEQRDPLVSKGKLE